MTLVLGVICHVLTVQLLFRSTAFLTSETDSFTPADIVRGRKKKGKKGGKGVG